LLSAFLIILKHNHVLQPRKLVNKSKQLLQLLSMVIKLQPFVYLIKNLDGVLL